MRDGNVFFYNVLILYKMSIFNIFASTSAHIRKRTKKRTFKKRATTKRTTKKRDTKKRATKKRRKQKGG